MPAVMGRRQPFLSDLVSISIAKVDRITPIKKE